MKKKELLYREKMKELDMEIKKNDEECSALQYSLKSSGTSLRSIEEMRKRLNLENE